MTEFLQQPISYLCKDDGYIYTEVYTKRLRMAVARLQPYMQTKGVHGCKRGCALGKDPYPLFHWSNSKSARPF